MASGKQSKRRRREAERLATVPSRRPRARVAQPGRVKVPAPPVEGGRSRQASPKVLIGAAAALVVIAAVVGVVLAVTGGGSSSSSASVPDRGSLANALPGGAEAQRLFGGIPQHGNVLGPPNAPVTMVEYVDAQCPYCREFEAQTLPKLLAGYVRPGTLRIEARPIVVIGPDSSRGRLAAIAAGDQNRMFNFLQLLYFNQGAENTGWLNDSMITAAAASIPGLDVPRLLSAQKSDGVAGQAHAFDMQATDDRVSRTPTILVGRTGRQGRQVPLASPTDVQAIAAAIAQAKRQAG